MDLTELSTRTKPRLVHHHHRVRRQIRLAEKLPKQHTVSHVLELGLLAGAVLREVSPTRIVYLFARRFTIHRGSLSSPEVYARYIQDQASGGAG